MRIVTYLVMHMPCMTTTDVMKSKVKHETMQYLQLHNDVKSYIKTNIIWKCDEKH